MGTRLTRALRRGWLAALLALAAPVPALAASIGLEGGAIVLGKTESMPITVRVDEIPGTEDLPLRLSVNVGSFSEPMRLGPGKYRVTYVPPTTRFPQVALVAVWRETGTDARIDFIKFPLFGTARVPVASKNAVEVRAKIGFDSFGPVPADKKGRALIAVTVPPDVHFADVTIKDRVGVSVTKQVPIEVPGYNRLTAALVPHAVLADGQSEVRLDVFYDLGGADVPPDRIQVQPSMGRAIFFRAGKGRYVFKYFPPAGASEPHVSFTVTVRGDPTARATTRLDLGLPPPARVLVRPPPVELAAGSPESSTVGVMVLDATGMGLPGQAVKLAANGQPVTPLTYRGNGLYEAPWRAPASYPPGGLVQFQGSVAVGPRQIASQANYQLQAAPKPGSVMARFTPSPVPADGRTVARLVLDVRDAAGLPLENAQLIPVVSDGTLGPLEAAGRGRLTATYVAPAALPDGEVVLKVVDENGGFERTLPVPVRSNPRRFLLGLTAGYALSPGDAAGPRFGVEAWVPWRAGGFSFASGVAASYGSAARTVTDATGTLQSRSEATFVPVALKLGWEIVAARRFSVTLGGGAVGTFATFKNALAGGETSAWGLGGLGFAQATWALGPGQLVLEAFYAYAPVESGGFRLDAGGPGALAGYRLGIF
jgi:hypothetical protein